MEVKIIQQKKNVLLSREEFLLDVVSKNNPTKEEIVSFLKKDPQFIVINEIQGNFGRDVFRVDAFVYDSLDSKNKVEYLPRKIRKKIEEEKKKKQEEEKAAEEAKKAQENKVEGTQ